ncbi:hypothetical protein JHK85_025539 [Glycine max]|nr:hypothetical protein JHK85_025539 [Glycine max]
MPFNQVVLVNLCGRHVWIVLCVCVGFVGGSIVWKGIKMEELTSEKKTTEENLASAKDEIANLKKNLKNMESELQKKEKIGSDLMVELDEAKRLIVLNHRKALKRPNIK